MSLVERQQAKIEDLEITLGEVRRFLDCTVRWWLPTEHTNCAIDSGCSHGETEREMFEMLERVIDLCEGRSRHGNTPVS